MLNKLFSNLKYYFLSIFLAVSVFLPKKAYSDFGLKKTAGAAKLDTADSLPVIIGNVIGTALSMISVLFFILMVYGGFLWMTARGNEEQSKQAKNTIIYAVIGILVVLSSYALTTFVFSSMGGGGNTGGTGYNVCYQSYLSQDLCESTEDQDDCVWLVGLPNLGDICIDRENYNTCNTGGLDDLDDCLGNLLND